MRKTKKNLYISMPITGYDINERISRSNELKMKFLCKYENVVTPFDACHYDEKKSYGQCMKECLGWLVKCDVIYFDKGWEKSKGCVVEKAVAKSCDIEMMYHTGYSFNTLEYKDKLVKHVSRHTGIDVNLDNPKTINEKLVYLNLYECNPNKTKCADKIKVHEYCKEKIGEDLCIPILKVYDKAEDVDLSNLPDKFVIKCNHGNAMNIIVTDKSKANIADIRSRLNKWMNWDFSTANVLEAQYHDIDRKIFVEKYMNDGHSTLHDYKLWCFNGEPKMYSINDGNGHGDIMYYHMDGTEWNLYGVRQHPEYKRPRTFDKMVEIARKLSAEFSFVRVDFYEIDGRVYLGEMTFTPGAFLFKYKNREDHNVIGDMLNVDLVNC